MSDTTPAPVHVVTFQSWLLDAFKPNALFPTLAILGIGGYWLSHETANQSGLVPIVPRIETVSRAYYRHYPEAFGRVALDVANGRVKGDSASLALAISAEMAPFAKDLETEVLINPAVNLQKASEVMTGELKAAKK